MTPILMELFAAIDGTTVVALDSCQSWKVEVWDKYTRHRFQAHKVLSDELGKLLLCQEELIGKGYSNSETHR